MAKTPCLRTLLQQLPRGQKPTPTFCFCLLVMSGPHTSCPAPPLTPLYLAVWQCLLPLYLAIWQCLLPLYLVVWLCLLPLYHAVWPCLLGCPLPPTLMPPSPTYTPSRTSLYVMCAGLPNTAWLAQR